MVPADKKLPAEWIGSLCERGVSRVLEGDELRFIGMPVVGIGCGQLYMAGDGRLWLLDIFKSDHSREPLAGLKFELMTINGLYTLLVDSRTGEYSTRRSAIVYQGFASQIWGAGLAHFRRLDGSGFPLATFCGD